jgi:hypothetical protein
MDNTALLAQIDTAIEKILMTGQSYKIGSRSLTRADLSELKEWKKQVENEIAAGDASNISGAYVAYFDGR